MDEAIQERIKFREISEQCKCFLMQAVLLYRVSESVFFHDLKAEDCVILKPFPKLLMFKRFSGFFLKSSKGACKSINNVNISSCPSRTVLEVKLWRCVS